MAADGGGAVTGGGGAATSGVVRKLVLRLVRRLYYCKNGMTLSSRIKGIKVGNDDDFVRCSYDNGNMVDLYIEHLDYDVLNFINEEQNSNDNNDSSDDAYSSQDKIKFDYVDFSNKGEERVLILNVTTHDPFLN
ncbi:hypothetical protein Tco_1286208 [Tanacetum coccineum]